jgi:hypothetical protein
MANKTDKYNIDKIIELHDRSALRGQAERYSYERDWFRNVLYFLGIQWITYSPATRKWSPRKIAKWVPRPVTNKFASVAMSIIQVLTQRDPTVRARAATDNPDDIAAAEIADRNFDVILQEAGAKEAKNMAASWLTFTGSAIFHPYYDNDPIHGTSFLPHLLCPQCQKTFPPDAPSEVGTMPAVGGGMPGLGQQAGEAPISPTQPPMSGGIQSATPCPFCGNPQVVPAPEGVGEELPKGKVRLDTYSPFEVFVELEGGKWSDNQRLLARRRFDVDEIRRKFNRPDLEPDNNSNIGGAIGLNLLRAIAYASGNAVYGTGIASGRSLGDDQSITIDQLWVRPCSEYPEGLVAIFDSANNLLNEDTVKEGIPYRDQKGNPLWTWHLAKFDHVPGRMFGRTPLDDVAPKQEQRNKLESMIQLIVTRTANPVWLIAKNLGITQITGDPGQILEGNWAMDPRLKPERLSGENIPTSLIAWLEKIDKDIEELGGIFEVLKGSAPPGVTAGTALRLLLERATTRFAPVSQGFEDVWQAVCQDLLTLAQQNWIEERISKVQGPGNSWEIKAFTNADIAGSIDIIVEAGSSLPKSLVGEQALIQDLTNMGVINPQNPETQYKILQRFGSTDLLGDIDLNMRYAQRENWDFDQEAKLPEMDLIIDLHQVHIMVHKELALKSDFMTWPEEKKNAWRSHIVDHMLALAPPMGGEDGEPAPGEGSNKKPGEKKEKPAQPNEGAPMEAPMPGGIM